MVTNVGYCRVEYHEQPQHSNINNIYFASFPCTVSKNWSRYSVVSELSNDVFSVPCEQRIPSQAKPGQAIHLTGGGDLREAGLYNRHLNLTGECANANDFEVRLRALTDLAKTRV
jgi:hypothetical protein